ncbi:methionine-tRNA ligase [Colletotrichum sp. SAR11_240]|nr:methionine-tRNA ligase [Colletotrichum sp. SAR11_240]
MFPFQDVSRQLILDVQMVSGANAPRANIINNVEEYAALGAKINSNWAGALSNLLHQIRSGLYSIKNSTGNDAAVVCATLERDLNKRIKERIERLDASKDHLGAERVVG